MFPVFVPGVNVRMRVRVRVRVYARQSVRVPQLSSCRRRGMSDRVRVCKQVTGNAVAANERCT